MNFQSGRWVSRDYFNSSFSRRFSSGTRILSWWLVFVRVLSRRMGPIKIGMWRCWIKLGIGSTSFITLRMTPFRGCCSAWVTNTFPHWPSLSRKKYKLNSRTHSKPNSLRNTRARGWNLWFTAAHSNSLFESR